MINKIKKEISSYKAHSVEISEGHNYSAYKIIRRISLFENEIYPTGKTDSQGNYKYFFNIIKPRSNAEIKNIDFDSKDIKIYSETTKDAPKIILTNAHLTRYLSESGHGEKLNTAIERFSNWGSVLFKKVKNDYIVMDLTRVMVLNTTAESIEDSDVIEEEVMYMNDLRKKQGVWFDDGIRDLIEKGANKKDKSSPEFWIYERNGEVSEKEYNQAKGLGDGDENKFYVAKVIVGGTEKDNPTILLYCDYLNKKPYKEGHRTAYTGTWLRVGMYRLLMDVQIRANEIGNQIARGLEWSSKTVFRSSDKIMAQNILTDLKNGDVIKSVDLVQVNTRMEGIDQLIADWNRLRTMADQLANSFEIVTGESLPSGTPFSLGALQNVNASKLFDFLREKLGLALQPVIEDWVLPGLMKELKAKKVMELTQDGGYLSAYYKMVVDDWYIKNLVSLPPHTPEMAEEIKTAKLEELQKNKKALIKLENEMWNDFKPRASVVITGENFNITSDLETLKTFITLEQDPIRRTALIEMAMGKKNIDITMLPKSPPEALQPTPRPQTEKQPTQLDRAIEAAK